MCVYAHADIGFTSRLAPVLALIGQHLFGRHQGRLQMRCARAQVARWVCVRLAVSAMLLVSWKFAYAQAPLERPSELPPGSIPKELKKVAPKAESAVRPLGPGLPTPVTRIVYNRYACDTAWDQRCEGDVFMEASPGQQICRILFHKFSEGGRNHDGYVEPIDFAPNDSESPARFRKLKAHVFSAGSGQFWDREGAWVDMRDLGFSEIPAGANNQVRWKLGCVLAVPGQQFRQPPP